MKQGKISETVYKRSIIKGIHFKKPEVLQGVTLPGTSSAMRISGDGNTLVTAGFSSRNIGADAESIGIISVVNEIRSRGAEPLGVIINLLYPPGYTEGELKSAIHSFDDECARQGMPILSVNGEVTDNVVRPVINLTGLGKAQEGRLLSLSDCRPGQDIVMSKHAGMEGTWLIGQMKKAALEARFSQRFIMDINRYKTEFSVAREAAAAGRHGVTAMQNVREFGVFGALWDLGTAAKTGIRVELKKINIRQETIEVCELFGLNPYQLLSEGSLLMIADDGEALVHELEKEDIPASVIGRLTPGNDRVIVNDGEERYLMPPLNDEIEKLI
ncbi:AIR synthase-related protein [Parasporobacterium paucivorans]|uniref:Hydrogenase maturation factor n=1 Tax=Parasporobacterium paucivorans DSM 15970 TaxID=1122934 RepID=A0A1M6CVB2_9FIRM|nr:AIR synthase-related protein [Parasporobacterium paucivorans]SHI64781.1 Hydrogenase maturation factor [Parasporobacterium paucivorans DSM 15970]